jgi:ribosomal protein S18 acetylase RimI-like enzyme
VTIVPADTIARADLAALITAGYEGYFTTVAPDEAALDAMVDSWDLDLARSRIALDEDGAPVGVVLLGVRGDRGWIGGLGVVPAARRNGVARALMEAVLQQAPLHVTLEVIDRNEPAIRLYEELGFERVRTLDVWSLAAAVPPVGVRIGEPRPLGRTDLPWQCADESLPADYERLEVDGGAVLIRTWKERVGILQLQAESEEAARQLIAAARTRGEVLRFLNVPEDDPAVPALRALGGTLDVRQYELAITNERGAVDTGA